MKNYFTKNSKGQSVIMAMVVVAIVSILTIALTQIISQTTATNQSDRKAQAFQELSNYIGALGSDEQLCKNSYAFRLGSFPIPATLTSTIPPQPMLARLPLLTTPGQPPTTTPNNGFLPDSAPANNVVAPFDSSVVQNIMLTDIKLVSRTLTENPLDFEGNLALMGTDSTGQSTYNRPIAKLHFRVDQNNNTAMPLSCFTDISEELYCMGIGGSFNADNNPKCTFLPAEIPPCPPGEAPKDIVVDPTTKVATPICSAIAACPAGQYAVGLVGNKLECKAIMSDCILNAGTTWMVGPNTCTSDTTVTIKNGQNGVLTDSILDPAAGTVTYSCANGAASPATSPAPTCAPAAPTTGIWCLDEFYDGRPGGPVPPGQNGAVVGNLPGQYVGMPFSCNLYSSQGLGGPQNPCGQPCSPIGSTTDVTKVMGPKGKPSLQYDNVFLFTCYASAADAPQGIGSCAGGNSGSSNCAATTLTWQEGGNTCQVNVPGGADRIAGFYPDTTADPNIGASTFLCISRVWIQYGGGCGPQGGAGTAGVWACANLYSSAAPSSAWHTNTCDLSKTGPASSLGTCGPIGSYYPDLNAGAGPAPNTNPLALKCVDLATCASLSASGFCQP